LKSLASRFEDTVTISLSPSQDRALYGVGLKEDDNAAANVSPDPHLTVLQPWERAVSETAEFQYEGGDVGVNLWAEEEAKIKYKPVPPEMPMCPVHNLLCKKGICKEMAKIVKQQELAKKQQEREATRGKGRGRRGERFFSFVIYLLILYL
jgi:hypothetical protein